MTFESPREAVVKTYMNKYHWHGGIYRRWYRLWKYNRDIGIAMFFFFFGFGAGNLDCNNQNVWWTCGAFFIFSIMFGIAAWIDYMVEGALIKKAFDETNRHFRYQENPTMSWPLFKEIIRTQGYGHDK